jgi:RNA polymerase sigma factor (sigma-70 family)
VGEFQRIAEAELTAIARGAARGDEQAWHSLVTRMDRQLRGVARGFGLAPSDVEDAVQTTWLRALEHVARLNDPGAIAAWLVTTVRREAMRTLQRGTREVLVDGVPTDHRAEPSPESVVMARAQHCAVRDAVGRLGGRQRELMTSMLDCDTPDYGYLSSSLRMPVGSIGPTRNRALTRLRADPRLEMAVDG